MELMPNNDNAIAAAILAPAGLAIEWWPIDRVKPYEKNARVISPKAVEKVAASIREFGWRQPIVVDSEAVIVVGHVRLLAAQYLRLTHVPVHVASNLSPAQIKAYRLADNRVSRDFECVRSFSCINEEAACGLLPDRRPSRSVAKRPPRKWNTVTGQELRFLGGRVHLACGWPARQQARVRSEHHTRWPSAWSRLLSG